MGQKRKAAKESSSESESDDESEDDKKKAKKNGAANKRQRADSISSRTRGQSDVKEEKPVKPAKVQIPPANYKFQRINEDKFNAVLNQTHKEGASFESKARFGGEGDKFGEWSYEKLRDKRGESFKKEKGKMKNRNFHSAGHRISGVVNSFKF